MTFPRAPTFNRRLFPATRSGPSMTLRENYRRWRYRLIPDHVVGEVLAKDWIDTAIPFAILVITLAVFGDRKSVV